MNVIRPEIYVERNICVHCFPDEVNGCVCKPPSNLRPLHPDRRAGELLGILPDASLLSVRCFSQWQQLWAHPLKIRQGCIETIVGDRRGVSDVPLPSHVPLAKVTGAIACLFQEPRKCGSGRIKPLGNPPFFIVIPVGEVRADLPTLGIVPCCQRHPRR